jgi:hypothetical protein
VANPGRPGPEVGRLMDVLWWILAGLVAVAFIAVVWWGTGGPPTRPRPRSRYRGPTYLDVHKALERRRKR